MALNKTGHPYKRTPDKTVGRGGLCWPPRPTVLSICYELAIKFEGKTRTALLMPELFHQKQQLPFFIWAQN